MKIGILTTGSKQEDERLVDEAMQAGHEATLLKVLKCSLRVSNNAPKVFYEGKDISNDFDIIIPRVNLPHTIYGLTILRHFQVMGIHTSDVALALEIGRDKLRCKQFLMSQGIPVPTTGYGYSKDDFHTAIQAVGGAPLILKLIEGTEGTGVFLAKDEKEAVNILGSFKQFDARVIAQEFIEESSGSDIRAFVVGNKVVASMLRQSQDGDFRANVALGAHSFKVTLTDEEEKDRSQRGEGDRHQCRGRGRHPLQARAADHRDQCRARFRRRIRPRNHDRRQCRERDHQLRRARQGTRDAQIDGGS
jgi:ribosomal protein S6--L-glutamate ligase